MLVFSVGVGEDCQRTDCNVTKSILCAAAEITPTPVQVVKYHYQVERRDFVALLERTLLQRVANRLGLVGGGCKNITSMVTGVSLEPLDSIQPRDASCEESGGGGSGTSCFWLVEGGMTIYLDDAKRNEVQAEQFFWGVLQDSLTDMSTMENGESFLVENLMISATPEKEQIGAWPPLSTSSSPLDLGEDAVTVGEGQSDSSSSTTTGESGNGLSTGQPGQSGPSSFPTSTGQSGSSSLPAGTGQSGPSSLPTNTGQAGSSSLPAGTGQSGSSSLPTTTTTNGSPDVITGVSPALGGQSSNNNSSDQSLPWGAILGGTLGGLFGLLLLCVCCFCFVRRRRREPGPSLLRSVSSSNSRNDAWLPLETTGQRTRNTDLEEGQTELARQDSLALQSSKRVSRSDETDDDSTSSPNTDEDELHGENSSACDNLAGTDYASGPDYDSDVHYDTDDVKGIQRMATVDVDDLMTSDDGGGFTTDDGGFNTDDGGGFTTDDSADGIGPNGHRRNVSRMLQALDENSTGSYDEEIMGVLGHVPSPNDSGDGDDINRSSAESPRSSLQMT